MRVIVSCASIVIILYYEQKQGSDYDISDSNVIRTSIRNCDQKLRQSSAMHCGTSSKTR